MTLSHARRRCFVIAKTKIAERESLCELFFALFCDVEAVPKNIQGALARPPTVNLLVFLLLLCLFLRCHGFYSPFQFFWIRNVALLQLC
jgi:hypothetical protein